MGNDERDVYAVDAERYDALVSAEDVDGNLLRALHELVLLRGADVVELGAGTGRLTRLLAPLVRSIVAYDAAPAMLAVARQRLAALGLANWRLAEADHCALPAADHSADLVVAGWTICYTVVWHPDDWQAQLARALAEMRRVLRPGGTIVIFETLGTGVVTPDPPSHLADYYAALAAAGFESRWFRTDYQFASPAQAADLSRFFFGDALADQVAAAGSARVPECTGVWWWRAPQQSPA